MEPCRLTPGQDCFCRSRHELRPDASTLLFVRDVEVVQEGPPYRIVVEDGVDEPRDHAFIFHGDGAMEPVGPCEALSPGRPPFLEDVPIEELVGVGTTIVPPPAIGVESGDRFDVPFGRLAVLHEHRCTRHAKEDDRISLSRRCHRTPGRRRMPNHCQNARTTAPSPPRYALPARSVNSTFAAERLDGKRRHKGDPRHTQSSIWMLSGSRRTITEATSVSMMGGAWTPSSAWRRMKASRSARLAIAKLR